MIAKTVVNRNNMADASAVLRKQSHEQNIADHLNSLQRLEMRNIAPKDVLRDTSSGHFISEVAIDVHSDAEDDSDTECSTR